MVLKIVDPFILLMSVRVSSLSNTGMECFYVLVSGKEIINRIINISNNILMSVSVYFIVWYAVLLKQCISSINFSSAKSSALQLCIFSLTSQS